MSKKAHLSSKAVYMCSSDILCTKQLPCLFHRCKRDGCNNFTDDN